MQLTLENPDFRYSLRGAGGDYALVNERRLEASFLLAPNDLVTGWRPATVADLQPQDMDAVLAMQPARGSAGWRHCRATPAPAVMATCLTRGIGIEVMDNAAAARTFNVLATEGRRVVAAFLIQP